VNPQELATVLRLKRRPREDRDGTPDARPVCRRRTAMVQRLVTIVLCATLAIAGCATKRYVQEQVTVAESKLAQQVTATETALGQRSETQETRLREVVKHTDQNREAIDVSNQRLAGLDTRVTEADTAAADARARAEQATATAEDAEARLAQRLAGRNRYRVMDTKAVYFDSGRTDIRQQDAAVLDEVAKALAGDPNAILELQGFADSKGSDRHNRELARERVDVVMRYLMQRHQIELRQLHGIGMGTAPGDLAEARRVDLRVLAPWSSWEERAAAPGSDAPSALPEQAQHEDAPRRRLPTFLRSLSPRELGGE
jgi:outer membrane protein OmpA-like peptidoglycan-associated protein